MLKRTSKLDDMFAAWFVFLVASLVAGEGQKCTDIAKIPELTLDTKLLSSTFRVFKNVGLMVCAKECVSRLRCKSFNFDLNKSECELNELSASGSLPSSIVNVQNNVYVDIDQWSRGVAGACQGRSCPNNSVCRVLDNGTSICNVECSDPPSLTNGVFTTTISNDVDSVIDFTCSLGYEKMGSAVCQSDGSWSSYSCVQGLDCSSPMIPNITISSLSSPPFPSGTILNYTCPEGYLGSGHLVCTTNGTWSSVSCEQGCTDPPSIVNANINDSSTTFAVGTTVNYTCIHGYIANGQVTCQSTYTWSTMFCIRVCIDPPSITNGTLIDVGEGPWPNGTLVNYKCDPIFFKEGGVGHKVECLDTGQWSTTTCHAIRQCDHLQTCRSSYGDGEYWMYPYAFGFTAVKIYCHAMSTSPKPYITLPGEASVDYSKTNCEQNKGYGGYKSCRSTTFSKAGVLTWHMKSFSPQLKDMTFIDQPSCDKIIMGWVFDCSKSCSGVSGRKFNINTSLTGLIVDPDQPWKTTTGNVVITRSESNRVVSGRCENSCGSCTPVNNFIKYIIDPGYTPLAESATTPECVW
ncbi:complement receptor type 1-like [Haliotis rubra]|uniref:complement receptor type 1-like n=1 Tax=Haliotis rubra TaxID=36100 RepID=UPI001EE5169D|nr:complement receptor type 1-like [Haliotis rubra]